MKQIKFETVRDFLERGGTITHLKVAKLRSSGYPQIPKTEDLRKQRLSRWEMHKVGNADSSCESELVKAA